MKVVFDTNVLLAAFLAEGLCATLLRRARRREFDLIVCPGIMAEFEEKLRSKKIGATKAETDAAVEVVALASIPLVPRPEATVSGISRDPKDDHVLACAVASKADLLVTGDKDLLVLREFGGIPIVSPRDFELRMTVET